MSDSRTDVTCQLGSGRDILDSPFHFSPSLTGTCLSAFVWSSLKGPYSSRTKLLYEGKEKLCCWKHSQRPPYNKAPLPIGPLKKELGRQSWGCPADRRRALPTDAAQAIQNQRTMRVCPTDSQTAMGRTGVLQCRPQRAQAHR